MSELIADVSLVTMRRIVGQMWKQGNSKLIVRTSLSRIFKVEERWKGYFKVKE